LGAAAVAVGVCLRDGHALAESIRALRQALPAPIEVWVGGPGAEELTLPEGVSRVRNSDELERKVELLALRGIPR
jgi:hypothetical protein